MARSSISATPKCATPVGVAAGDRPDVRSMCPRLEEARHGVRRSHSGVWHDRHALRWKLASRKVAIPWLEID